MEEEYAEWEHDHGALTHAEIDAIQDTAKRDAEQKLLEGKKTVATAWNFGPAQEDAVCVRNVARKLSEAWPAVRFECADTQSGPHEAGLLRLDCRRARQRLGWQPVWDLAETLKRTAAWYRAFYEQGAVRTREDLEAYVATATEKDLAWTH